MSEAQVYQQGTEIDWSEVWARVGDDAGLLAELVALFLQDAPQYLAQIYSAVQRNDAEGLAASAHSLKGSAAVFGLKRLVRLLAQLELFGREGRAGQADAIYREASDEMSRMTTALQNTLRKLVGTEVAN